MPRSHFTPELFEFLNDLKHNNERDWFQANKERYIQAVKEPALAFISDFAPRLEAISPHFRADPRPVGGSLFRIYRDVRFSRDKSPYKTHAGLHFRHEAGTSAYTPGFYLHLEPGGCFVGVGLWHPDGPTLRAIRMQMVEQPKAFTSVLEDTAFKHTFEVDGERLKRAPRGFDVDHPLIEYLKLKDVTAMVGIDEGRVLQRDFIDDFEDLCQAGAPLAKFICTALDQPF